MTTRNDYIKMSSTQDDRLREKLDSLEAKQPTNTAY
jgi:hypothetical protein